MSRQTAKVRGLASAIVAAGLVLIASAAMGDTFSVLGTFNGSNGSRPEAGLTLSADGKTLYGTTAGVGIFSPYIGNVFSEPVTGGTPTVLYTFTGGISDGSSPYGALILSGSTLYGTAAGGGASGVGTVFSEPRHWRSAHGTVQFHRE